MDTHVNICSPFLLMRTEKFMLEILPSSETVKLSTTLNISLTLNLTGNLRLNNSNMNLTLKPCDKLSSKSNINEVCG